jgi:hypothetical protein
MASEATVDKFIKTILQIWPPYRWEDKQEKDWIGIVATKISGFSDQIIERALSEIVGKRDDRRTPLPAEVISACVEAKRWLDVENGQKVLPTINDDALSSKHPEWAPSRISLADDLVCGKNGSAEVGRQAAKDHYWILQLHDFCRVNTRLPSDTEIAALKRQAKETDDEFAKFTRDGKQQWAVDRGLWAIQVVSDKRNQLCDMVLHGVVRS